MKNYRLTIDLQMDSNKTAVAFAHSISKTMMITADVAVDLCEHEEAHIRLGRTTVVSADTFEPNAQDNDA